MLFLTFFQHWNNNLTLFQLHFNIEGQLCKNDHCRRSLMVGDFIQYKKMQKKKILLINLNSLFDFPAGISVFINGLINVMNVEFCFDFAN